MVWVLRTSPLSRWSTVNGVWIDEDCHAEPFVEGANAEVMHAARAAEADLAEAVECSLRTW
jgi:hypothetical protein